MYSSPIMTCFVQYSTFTVYHILCLYSMFLPFSRVVALSLSLVLWSWYLLFGRVYESLETWKVLLFHFIYSPKPCCTFIQFLWQWDTLLDKWFYNAYIPTNIALVKIE
jgi:hypothetical protein